MQFDRFNSLGGLGKACEPEKTEKQIKAVIERLCSLAQNTELDIGAVGKSFNKGTQNLLGELELRGVEQREQLEEAKAKYEELEKQINDIWKTKPFLVEEADIEELRRKQKNLNIEQLENDIAHNKQLRLMLKTAAQQAKIDAVKAKLEAAENKAWKGSLRDNAKYLIYERKENNVLIKQLQE